MDDFLSGTVREGTIRETKRRSDEEKLQRGEVEKLRNRNDLPDD